MRRFLIVNGLFLGAASIVVAIADAVAGKFVFAALSCISFAVVVDGLISLLRKRRRPF